MSARLSCQEKGKVGSESTPVGWAEMVDALRLVRRGFENGSIESKPVIQFPAPGSKKRHVQITSVEKIVKQALRKAGVK